MMDVVLQEHETDFENAKLRKSEDWFDLLADSGILA